jgi:hypothetical protein
MFLVPVERVRLVMFKRIWTNRDSHLIPLSISIAVYAAIEKVGEEIYHEICTADDN